MHWCAFLTEYESILRLFPLPSLSLCRSGERAFLPLSKTSPFLLPSFLFFLPFFLLFIFLLSFPSIFFSSPQNLSFSHFLPLLALGLTLSASFLSIPSLFFVFSSFHHNFTMASVARLSSSALRASARGSAFRTSSFAAARFYSAKTQVCVSCTAIAITFAPQKANLRLQWLSTDPEGAFRRAAARED